MSRPPTDAQTTQRRVAFGPSARSARSAARNTSGVSPAAIAPNGYPQKCPGPQISPEMKSKLPRPVSPQSGESTASGDTKKSPSTSATRRCHFDSSVRRT